MHARLAVVGGGEVHVLAVRQGLDLRPATPGRKSGRSLGAAFRRLIVGPSIRERTAAGMLVPLRIYNTPIVAAKELRALSKDTDNDY